MSTMATAKVTSRATSTKIGPSQSVAPRSGERTRAGSGPKATSATFSSTSATPSIRRICISWGASMIRSTSTRWTSAPEREQRGRADDEAERRDRRPRGSRASQARYIPHTIMSPWAKLTTRITPKIRVSPTAMRL